MPLKFFVKFHFGFSLFLKKNDGKGKLRKRENEKPNRILTLAAVVFGVTRAPHAHTLSASRERDRRGDMLSVLSLRSVRIWRVGAMLSSLFESDSCQTSQTRFRNFLRCAQRDVLKI